MNVTQIRRHILFYDYVTDNLLERRAPLRDSHLSLIREWQQDGRILMAGALGDPPHSAAIVFAVDDTDEIAQFVESDPYVAGGIVSAWRVEPWTVVF